jgi:hypothetical protein
LKPSRLAPAELQAVDDDVWLAEGGLVSFFGFPYPTRSVIVRLAGGELWVWSPVALSAELEAGVRMLGNVGHLVSPNKLHHLFLADWQARFPGARLWGPASVHKKRRDLTFESALEDVSPPEWGQDLDLAWFTGSPVLDEIVFFHRPSRTVLLADLSENFSEEFLQTHWPAPARLLARLWKITEGHGRAPLEWRLSWIRRGPARQALAKMLDWDPVRVIMAHGEWQRQGGRAYLERAFSWLTG